MLPNINVTARSHLHTYDIVLVIEWCGVKTQISSSPKQFDVNQVHYGSEFSLYFKPNSYIVRIAELTLDICCSTGTYILCLERLCRLLPNVAKNVGFIQWRLLVCLFVVNTITSERVNKWCWNLRVGVLYKNLGRVRMWGHSSTGFASPQNVAFDHDVWPSSLFMITFANTDRFECLQGKM